VIPVAEIRAVARAVKEKAGIKAAKAAKNKQSAKRFGC
jgi:hypothetical protein